MAFSASDASDAKRRSSLRCAVGMTSRFLCIILPAVFLSCTPMSTVVKNQPPAYQGGSYGALMVLITSGFPISYYDDDGLGLSSPDEQITQIPVGDIKAALTKAIARQGVFERSRFEEIPDSALVLHHIRKGRLKGNTIRIPAKVFDPGQGTAVPRYYLILDSLYVYTGEGGYRPAPTLMIDSDDERQTMAMEMQEDSPKFTFQSSMAIWDDKQGVVLSYGKVKAIEKDSQFFTGETPLESAAREFVRHCFTKFR